jgi:hypothetical protein
MPDIGIYSGGPNEQGYNNIMGNQNTHNNGNHIPFFDNMGEDSRYSSGVHYSDFPNFMGSEPYPGNLIYDINNFLFRGIWNESLTSFGLVKPN